jgi:hypothetical protein
MNQQQQTRRRFLTAALALTGAAAVHGPLILAGSRAWAGSTTSAGARAALLRVTRLLYPHDALGDEVYAEVLDQAMAAIADDAQFERLLQEAEAALDRLPAGPFVDASPGDQLAALRSIEDQPHFATIQGAVANRLYSHPEVWAMLGYEGASWQKGGYIDRGSGDIDWLPEDGS